MHNRLSWHGMMWNLAVNTIEGLAPKSRRRQARPRKQLKQLSFDL